MSTSFSMLGAMRQSFMLAVVAGSAAAFAGAQTGVQGEATSAAAHPTQFQIALPMAQATSDAALFSSSSSSAETAGEATQTNLASLEKNFAVPGMDPQYGRRRYGATRYRGSNTNGDGSEKYTAYAGVGAAIPTSDNSNYLTTSWGIQGGVGRNFNRHFGVNLEFDYDHFGLTGQTLSNQSELYFDDPVPSDNGLDGNSHIWSFSLQPTYQIYSGQGLGAYLTAGVGFYHKVTNFTTPQEEQYYDPYFGFEEFLVNGTYDHYTSNAPGFDGGIGLTYKFSRFANEKFYAEVRYVYVDNSYRPGYTVESSTYTGGSNFFPQNSQTTEYIPFKVGIRF